MIRRGIIIGSLPYQDWKQRLWIDCLNRGLIQRHNPKKTKLSTWIIYCLSQTFCRQTVRDIKKQKHAEDMIDLYSLKKDHYYHKEFLDVEEE